MTEPVSIEKNRHHPDGKDEKKPLNPEQKLEAGLEDSMDASDPPAVTAPGDHGDPVPSSGFKEDDEKADK